MTELQLSEAAHAAIDHDLIAKAGAALAEVRARYDAALQTRTAAANAAVKAADAIAELVARGVQGEAVAMDTVAGAYAAERAARDVAAHAGSVVAELRACLERATAALAATEAEAHKPLIAHAAELRIAAAARMDAAVAAAKPLERLHGQRFGTIGGHPSPELAAAREERAAADAAGKAIFAESFALIHHAHVVRGATMPRPAFPGVPEWQQPPPRMLGHMPQWPSSELAERTFWGIAAPDPDAAELEAETTG